jgi:hypothetical protein
MKESKFQRKLIRDIETRFPNCVIIKTDPSYIRSFPDLMILVGHRWAALETKRDPKAPHQPNQQHWIHELYLMSYAAFVHPYNKEEILDEMERTFNR